MTHICSFSTVRSFAKLNMSKCDAQDIRIKTEPDWNEGTSSEDTQPLLMEYIVTQTAVQVKEEEDYIKEEPEWSDEEAGLRGVSAAAARAGLYANHVVKDELVLGPEGVQPADAAFTLRDFTRQNFQVIRAKTKTSLLFVGGDLKKEELKVDVEREASVSRQVYSVTDANFGEIPDVDHLTTANFTKRTAAHKCSHCSYASYRRSNLLLHKRKHTGEKPYKCTYCSFASAQKRRLLVHERKHTGEKPYKCSHCSYSSADKTHLKYHETKHTGEKSYKCNHCNYASARKDHLLSHEQTHTDEKPYKCSYCNFSSGRKSTLRVHERKHTGEKPYKCSYCNFSSGRKSTLRVHERKHTGEMPYKCSYCSFASGRKITLRVHERKHTGEKPYKSSHCSYACADKNNLRRHERLHTGEKLYKCSYVSVQNGGQKFTNEKNIA